MTTDASDQPGAPEVPNDPDHHDLPPELFRALVDAASDFIGTVDRSGALIYLNPAGRRMLDIPLDEDIRGHSVIPYNAPPDPTVIPMVEQLRERDDAFTGVNVFVSRTGRRIPVSQMMVSHRFEGKRWFSTIAREITEQLARERELQRRADHDSLTGLLNRSAFFPAVERFAPQPGESSDAVLAMLDLDRFKSINDTYGHAIGDSTLTYVARCILEWIGDEDGVVARLGGDEFVVVLAPATQRTNAVATEPPARRFARLEEELLRVLASFGAGVSIGAVRIGRMSIEEAIRAADELLYERKRIRRGQGSLEWRGFEALRDANPPQSGTTSPR